jgi:hypothetical protein
MPTSTDPEKRARQLANLRQGPPAPRGNVLGLRHGAYARITEAELDATTRQIYEAVAQDAPVRAADGGLPSHDSLVVRQLAEALVRRQRVTTSEIRRGIEDKDGRVRGVVEYGLRLDDQILSYCKELGMTPRSRAALGLHLVTAASAAERLDAHLRAHHDVDGDAS